MYAKACDSALFSAAFASSVLPIFGAGIGASRGSDDGDRHREARPANSVERDSRRAGGVSGFAAGEGSEREPRGSDVSRWCGRAKMSASITLLIPTYNRIRALEAVWPSYLGHPDVAKIIVIDDGSTDGTKERVEDWATRAPVPVSVIRHDTQRGQPASRMSGIAASDTEWVLFGEDDVWIASSYCATLLSEANELGASMIAGRIVTARVPGEFNTSCLVDPPAPIRKPDEVFDFDDMDADFSARTAAPVPAPFLHSIALIKRSLFNTVVFDNGSLFVKAASNFGGGINGNGAGSPA